MLGVRRPLEPLHPLVVAAGFLTRVPVPRMGVSGDDLHRASAAFPLVGLGITGDALGAANQVVDRAAVAAVAAPARAGLP